MAKKKVRIKVRKGRLAMHGYSTDKSKLSRHRALAAAVRMHGATSIWRALNAQVVFRRRAKGVGAKVRRIFERDRCWVEKTYKIGDGKC